MIAKPLFLAMAVALGLSGCRETAIELSHIGTYEWASKSFTGLSGIEITREGAGFIAISDRGWFLRGAFERDGAQIIGITLQELLPILDFNGLPVTARRVGDMSDAEGLALAPDGSYWISFERWAHVSYFTDPTRPAGFIQDHPSFSKFRDNRQLEALALDPEGQLYTFPEQPLKKGFPIYRLDDETWVIDGYLQQRNGFALVGADFDETGQLYLLERKLVLGLWWQNRIRRLWLDHPESEEILWTGGRGEYNNLEGISVWRDEIGPRLTLISDNNGMKGEPTQLVEYRLKE